LTSGLSGIKLIVLHSTAMELVNALAAARDALHLSNIARDAGYIAESSLLLWGGAECCRSSWIVRWQARSPMAYEQFGDVPHRPMTVVVGLETYRPAAGAGLSSHQFD
jgi:hypothetical protein